VDKGILFVVEWRSEIVINSPFTFRNGFTWLQEKVRLTKTSPSLFLVFSTWSLINNKPLKSQLSKTHRYTLEGRIVLIALTQTFQNKSHLPSMADGGKGLEDLPEGMSQKLVLLSHESGDE